jgi:hypothetical protein
LLLKDRGVLFVVSDETQVWQTASALLHLWPEKALEGVQALVTENLQVGDWPRACMWQSLAAAITVMSDKRKVH